MPRSSWVSDFAVIRVAVGAAVIAIAIAVLVTAPHLLGGPSGEEPNQKGHRYAVKEHWGPYFSPRDPYAPYQNTNCQSPKDREEADLCQQWRVAEATEKAVALTDSQYWWNVAQAVSTVLAAFATILAAWAAVSAARAARDSILETRRIGEAQVRAYISALPGSYEIGPHGLRIIIKYKNSGQSPALSIKVAARATFSIPAKVARFHNDCDVRATKDARNEWGIVPPGQEEETFLHWNRADIGEDAIKFAVNGLGRFRADGTLEWLDVFKQVHVIQLHFWTTDDGINIGGTRKGELYIHHSDHQENQRAG